MGQHKESFDTVEKGYDDFKDTIATEIHNIVGDQLSLVAPEESNTLSEQANQELTVSIHQNISKSVDQYDVHPFALYYALLSEKELNPSITKSELVSFAYDFLIKNSKNKLIRKLAKQLRKEGKAHE
ncbi:MAG TPA: hypothetical protein DIW15_04450 [Bavariicoccus seileri]|uniref:Uncharacterized protein n=1 Tax=Bavariicoccus seileri TaxID=549685 RepID=A0A3D4S646_9ENTE|nr:hypothetical protein [Bavariicoccus seileri]HCS93942.1 hypothetical protein [Bavariicoccus seileri]